MAYRRSARRSGSARRPARSYGRSARPYRARASRVRKRSSSGGRELVIRVVQEPANPVARPELIGLKPAPAARARKF